MIKSILIPGIAGMVLLLSACINYIGESDSKNQYFGIWQLDSASSEAIAHHCVVTEFADHPATFTLSGKGKDIVLQFNGLDNSWVAPANKEYFHATQILKSSVTGRLCNFETEITIHLRFSGNGQSGLSGTWRASSCRYCPVVYFNAGKLSQSNVKPI